MEKEYKFLSITSVTTIATFMVPYDVQAALLNTYSSSHIDAHAYCSVSVNLDAQDNIVSCGKRSVYVGESTVCTCGDTAAANQITITCNGVWVSDESGSVSKHYDAGFFSDRNCDPSCSPRGKTADCSNDSRNCTATCQLSHWTRAWGGCKSGYYEYDSSLKNSGGGCAAYCYVVNGYGYLKPDSSQDEESSSSSQT